MSSHRYTAHVTVPGHPRLEPGMNVVALLREADDWKTLVGWKDLDTGACAAPSPAWHRNRLIFLAVWLALAALVLRSPPLASALGWAPAVLCACIATIAAWEYRCWRRAASDAAAVEALQDEPRAPDA